MNPLLSPFLKAILAAYHLQLPQLHPNTVLALAIFQFLCEDFVGVMPSVPLLCHYFVPCVELGDAISGGVTFRLWDRLTEAYIPSDKKKWDEWQSSWCFA
jgi:sterol desaturase/sphingolipid hydroxylase (fatty acid hydroxylase superfamily)